MSVLRVQVGAEGQDAEVLPTVQEVLTMSETQTCEGCGVTDDQGYVATYGKHKYCPNCFEEKKQLDGD